MMESMKVLTPQARGRRYKAAARRARRLAGCSACVSNMDFLIPGETSPPAP
jgi:alkylhydroperoxidase family enzyme